jgi:hypothetical protein
MSVAQYIVSGLKLELKPKLQEHIEHDLDTVCGITGERIQSGIPWHRVIPSSTAEYLDLMNGMVSPYLGLPAAAAFKGSWNMGSRLIFEDGTMYHPYIAAQSAEKSERPFWSALVREAYRERQGQNCLCIVTDDFKKKIWPKARIGKLGTNTQVLLFDSRRLKRQNSIIDWARLIDMLDMVETIYTAGFNKQSIAEGLYNSYAALTEHGNQALDWETQLEKLRPLPEFAVALLIAQKPLKKKTEKQPRLL